MRSGSLHIFEWVLPAAASVTPDHFRILPPAQLLKGILIRGSPAEVRD